MGNVNRWIDVPRSASGWPVSCAEWTDTFNSKDSGRWTWSSHQTVPYNDAGNNVVKNTGTGNWDARFYRSSYNLTSGMSIQVRFKLDHTDSGARFAVESSGTYRRFGVVADQGKLYVQYNNGPSYQYPADQITNLQTNTWYVLRIMVDDSAPGFVVEAYQESNPSVYGRYSFQMAAGQSWRFMQWIYQGSAYVDDYQEFNPAVGDPFNNKNTTYWTWNAYQTVPLNDSSNNVVRNAGTGANYNATFYRSSYSLIGGEGLQLRFKVDRTDTMAHFTVVANDSTYRRFGAIANGGKLYVQYQDDGANWRYPADLITNLQVNVWYVLRIVVDDSGRSFYIEAYQENNPSVRGSYNVWMPTGKQWRFQHWLYRGNAYIDDYREFSTAGLSWTPDERMGFTYDALDRLTNADPVNGGQGYTAAYTYNPIGNMLSRNEGNVNWTYTYGNTAHRHAVTMLSNGWQFQYDANGNMTTRVEGSTYNQVFDAENRLVSVSFDDHTTTFSYDGDGNRVKSVEYDNLAEGVIATSNGTLNWPGAITNGDRWADSGASSSGEYAYTSQTGLRYVQLDLGAVYSVDRVKVWHYAADGRTYYGTKTQVSSDGVNWYTVFDSAVSGTYAETAAGRTYNFPARSVRYVRDYLNGSSANSGNHWVEIEAWGTRTTVYVGEHYEKNLTANQITKYYYLGGQRVAMRQGGMLYYLHADHLGSTSLTTNSSGNEVARQLYYPYGSTRWTSGALPTDRRFTGQQWEGGIGLYDYNARWYHPVLGRFVSADTMVPNPSSPQDFNRYTYVRNNPLKYRDPSGHCPENDQACWAKLYEIQQNYSNVHIRPSNLWNENDLDWVLQALNIMLMAFDGDRDWFKNALGDVTYVRIGSFLNFSGFNVKFLPNYVFLTNGAFSFGENNAVLDVIHETGHVIDSRNSDGGTFRLSLYTGSSCSAVQLAGKCIGPFEPVGETVTQGRVFQGNIGGYAATQPTEEFAETFTALVVARSNYPTLRYVTAGADQTYKMGIVADFLQQFKPAPWLNDIWMNTGYPGIFTPRPLN